MPVDAQLQPFLDVVSAAPGMSTHPPAEARRIFEQLAAGLRQAVGAVAEVAAVTDDVVADVPVRVYRPAGSAAPVPTVLFVHGGGWTIGSIEAYDDVARRVCRDVGAVVVSVGYRLAPEHPFPAAVDDVVAVLRWAVATVADLGGDPARMGVCGDSAGGNLAAVLARTARDDGTPLSAQLLWYPATNLVEQYPSMTANAEGYFLTLADTVWFAGNYLAGDAAAVTDPRVSPLQATSLADLPAAVVATAEFDPIRDDGEAYADALTAAGVPVRRRRFDGLVHGFVQLTGLSAACEAATAWTLAEFADLLRA